MSRQLGFALCILLVVQSVTSLAQDAPAAATEPPPAAAGTLGAQVEVSAPGRSTLQPLPATPAPAAPSASVQAARPTAATAAAPAPVAPAGAEPQAAAPQLTTGEVAANEAAPAQESVGDARAQNTWHGSTGGLYIIDGRSGEVGTLRLQLGFDYFRTHDWLSGGDTHEALGGVLSLR